MLNVLVALISKSLAKLMEFLCKILYPVTGPVTDCRDTEFQVQNWQHHLALDSFCNKNLGRQVASWAEWPWLKNIACNTVLSKHCLNESVPGLKPWGQHPKQKWKKSFRFCFPQLHCPTVESGPPKPLCPHTQIHRRRCQTHYFCHGQHSGARINSILLKSVDNQVNVESTMFMPHAIVNLWCFRDYSRLWDLGQHNPGQSIATLPTVKNITLAFSKLVFRSWGLVPLEPAFNARSAPVKRKSHQRIQTTATHRVQKHFQLMKLSTSQCVVRMEHPEGHP